MIRSMKALHEQALQVLMECSVEKKLAAVQELYQAWHDGQYQLQQEYTVESIPVPGRPPKPLLVDNRQVPSRNLGSSKGRCALVHAITHIEFNAINLALDAVYRFPGMPGEFYSDWLQVAYEEAEHFTMLRRRLQEMGSDYGELPAHNGLWEMTLKTAHDPLVRMALVPRVLEARGLDVTPGMIKRLQQAGDDQTVALLDIILREEVGHVAIGSRWYKYLCQQRGLNAEETFRELLQEYHVGVLKPPINQQARLAAGFDETELEKLIDSMRQVSG